MIAVTQTTENVWSVSVDGGDLALLHVISTLQGISKQNVVTDIVALGMLSYAHIVLDRMEKEWNTNEG